MTLLKCLDLDLTILVGVRQGDNMAPVLFLFLMNAFAESLEAIWESKGLDKVGVVHASDDDFENGIGNIRRHKKRQFQSSKLEELTVFQCLYVSWVIHIIGSFI